MIKLLSDFSGQILFVLLIVCGAYFTVRSRFVQCRYFLHMFSVFSEALSRSKENVTSFQALMISVAGRVGSGTIAGVGVALALGGPGAIFWMWVTAALGMASSFFECTLAQLYKRNGGDGVYFGGPAYYIRHGLGQHWLGILISLILIITPAFGFNSVQAHIITHSLKESFGIPLATSTIGVVVILGLVITGGIRRIATISDTLVPIKILCYLGVTLFVIFVQIRHLPEAIAVLFRSAFGIDPVFGGLVGSAITMGAKRGLFANEAGLGTAPNVAAVAEVKHPVAQGVVQSLSVFTDTFIMCTCTALLILLSGAYHSHQQGDGVTLTQHSVAMVVGSWGSPFISVILVLFAFTTIYYNYYLGENNLRFIFGRNRLILFLYRFLVLVLVFWSGKESLNIVLTFADTTMTLLALVNLVALVLLFKIGLRVMDDYQEQRKAGIAEPVFDSAKFSDLDLDLTAWKKIARPAGSSIEGGSLSESYQNS
ncbi:MAG: sodium:alanine symporter [Verrucomicrobia bacterium]|nr:MAG: sodium:alanine symporter [Verrucomicrobiota bacterium]